MRWLPEHSRLAGELPFIPTHSPSCMPTCPHRYRQPTCLCFAPCSPRCPAFAAIAVPPCPPPLPPARLQHHYHGTSAHTRYTCHGAPRRACGCPPCLFTGYTRAGQSNPFAVRGSVTLPVPPFSGEEGDISVYSTACISLAHTLPSNPHPFL